MDSILESLKYAGQEHLLTYYNVLPRDQQEQLVNDLEEIDWLELHRIYHDEVLSQLDQSGTKLKPAAKINDELIKELPSSCVEGTTQCNQKQLDEYLSIGLNYISGGKVAAILLAGGQGTRLGVDYPKGMYDVGPPINKSLFQLQAERISKLRDTAKVSTLFWYIMTSEATMSRTRDFFEEKNYFGLKKEEVMFFEQGTMPCFGFDGKVLLDDKFKISKSPDGNGGLYDALHKRGILDHMEKNGIEFVQVYCVDNILVRVCDPTFIGYCISKQVDAGAKVVEKVLPDEAVGTICMVRDQFKVIEYSEISAKIAEKRIESNGKLAFSSGNICDHFFRVQFLKTITGASKKLRYHLAIKKVPHVDLSTGQRVAKPQETCGIKLEKFIFDVFEFTQKFAVWEVIREDEFSPLKNADESGKDNPKTAREALLRAYKSGLLSC